MARPARIPSDDPIFPEQIGDDWVAFAKRVPNRAAPGIDRLVAPGSRGYSQDLGHGNGSAVFWQAKQRPSPLLLCQAHVGPLHPPAGELLFDMQVEADQAERDLNRLGLFIRLLYREGIHHMLMNERRITARERVTAEFVEGVLFCIHGESPAVAASGWRSHQHGEQPLGGPIELLPPPVHDAHRPRQSGGIQLHGHQASPFDLRLHGARRQNADSLPQRHGFLDHLDIVEVHDEVDLDPLRAQKAIQLAADAPLAACGTNGPRLLLPDSGQFPPTRSAIVHEPANTAASGRI